MRVAFLGLGGMGMPMAAHIARAGHQLTVWNRSRKPLHGFDGAEPTVAGSPAEAVRDAEAALTMLADDQAVQDVVGGGLLDALPAGAVHVSMSTIGIATARDLAARHAAAGRSYVAAPVLGRPDMAEAGKLWVLAGGEAQAMDRVRPLLHAVGRGVTAFGDCAWHANLAKIGANFMLAGMLETFGEAFAMMRRADIEPQHFLEAANAMFQSPVYASYGARIAAGKHEPALFKATLGLKDLRLAMAAADEFGVPMPVLDQARDSMLAVIAHGEAGKDWSVMARAPQHRVGLP